jgi:NitT/TauT family transport system permease protein
MSCMATSDSVGGTLPNTNRLRSSSTSFGKIGSSAYPYVVAFQTVPKVAIAPIVVIWFGYGVASKVVITATIAFFPVLANAIVGLRAAPQDQIEMCWATSVAT